MKTKTIKIITFSLLLITFFSVYSSVLAVDPLPTTPLPIPSTGIPLPSASGNTNAGAGSVPIGGSVDAGEYTVLAPLPGTTIGNNGKTTDLKTYLPNLFNLMIGMAAVLAFVVIVWGGFTYATTDSFFGKDEGKKQINNAVWGLVLVIGAWVILYTINPQILNFDLILPKPNVTTVTGGTPGVTPGVKMTDAQLAEHAANLAKLGSVKINNNGKPCTNGETSGCTNLNGLPPTVIPALKSLVIACGCEIKINGGTEGGHRSHGINLPVIDLDENPKLREYINSQPQRVQGNIKIISWKNAEGGGNYTAGFVYEGDGEGRSTGDHWHVSISN